MNGWRRFLTCFDDVVAAIQRHYADAVLGNHEQGRADDEQLHQQVQPLVRSPSQQSSHRCPSLALLLQRRFLQPVSHTLYYRQMRAVRGGSEITAIPAKVYQHLVSLRQAEQAH